MACGFGRRLRRSAAMHSIVREALKVGFPGGTYSHIFYVADVEASGRAMNGELNGGLDEAEFLAIFPLKGAGRARFIGTVKREAEVRIPNGKRGNAASARRPALPASRR
jgi:hypothetical protein